MLRETKQKKTAKAIGEDTQYIPSVGSPKLQENQTNKCTHICGAINTSGTLIAASCTVAEGDDGGEACRCGQCSMMGIIHSYSSCRLHCKHSLIHI